jgi:anti-anti-sigma factor
MLIAENYDEVLIAPPRLDSGSRLDFRRAALEHLERVVQRNETRVVIDLRHTTDIDASGLGVLVLVLVQKRVRERMIATKLLHAPASVKQMIALTKLEYLFELED